MKKYFIGFAASLFLIGAGCNNKIYQVSQSTIESSNTIAVGNPCTYTGAEGQMDTQGLQCYFYGEVDSSTGMRQGVWIKPEPFTQEPGVYQDFISEWNSYTTSDKKVSFAYPRVWSVDDANYSSLSRIDVVMGKKADQPSRISIEVVLKNGVAVKDRIAELKKNSSTVTENHFTLGGDPAVRLEVQPQNNLQPSMLYVLVDRGSYYVLATAQRVNNPLMDFPTENLLSTIRL